MADINIFNPDECPYMTLRLVNTDKITREVKSETVEFQVNAEKNTFTVSSGRTQVKFGKNKNRTNEKPLSLWENEVKSYLNRGFEFVTTEKVQKKTFSVITGFVDIKNKMIRKFVESIVEANDENLKQTYSKSIKEIPAECIKNASKILIEMQTDLQNDALNVGSFNRYLKALFTQLPIAVSKQDGYFAYSEDKKHFETVISSLQEKLDAIEQQLRDFNEEKSRVESGKVPQKTILDANNIEMREITPEEKAKILEMMSDQSQNFVRAWKVTNTVTEKRFQDYCDKEGLSEEWGISHLWHGTGFENLWSIFKSGLYLNPELIKSGVRICGKAFGYGLYFAPYCRKSMGYTSSCAAIHRSGGSNRGGYLLIFKVATGKPYDIYNEGHNRPNHWEDFHRDHPDRHCTWAGGDLPGANGLMRLAYDEVIVYQECQATIEYVVEFGDISY